MSVAEKQCNFNCLILNVLEGLTNIYTEFSQLTNMLFIDIVDLPAVSYVEDYAHYCLARSNWAVDLCMDLIHAHRVSFSNESIDHVLTEFLTLNNYLLILWMHFGIESC